MDGLVPSSWACSGCHGSDAAAAAGVIAARPTALRCVQWRRHRRRGRPVDRTWVNEASLQP